MAQPAPHLPNEILHKIMRFSANKELSQARLVSCQWCAISTVYLFEHQRFNVLGYKKGENVFRNVLMTRHLVKCVQDLVVEVSPVSRPKSRRINHGITDLLQRREKALEYELTGTVQDTFHDLYRLDHLSTLNIHFDYDIFYPTVGALEKGISFRRRILTSVLTPLLCLPSIKPPIHSLSIENLQCSNEPKLTDSAWFIDLLRNLRTLALTLSQIGPRTRFNREIVQPTICLFQDLPGTWLRPACQNLRSLYLSGGNTTGDTKWGWYPKADFRHVHFPLLQSLTFEEFVFSHDWQLQWLLRLAGSLRYLRLSSCFILVSADTTPQFLDSEGYRVRVPANPNAVGTRRRCFEEKWSHYFEAFARRLPLLQFFSLWSPYRQVVIEDVPIRRDTELTALHCYLHSSSYTYFRNEVYYDAEYYPYENPASVETPQQDTERKQLRLTQDEQALLRLLDTIEERKTARL